MIHIFDLPIIQIIHFGARQPRKPTTSAIDYLLAEKKRLLGYKLAHAALFNSANVHPFIHRIADPGNGNAVSLSPDLVLSPTQSSILPWRHSLWDELPATNDTT